MDRRCIRCSPGQLLAKIRDDVSSKAWLSTHDEAGQISRRVALFRAMHEQCPRFVIRIQHVRVVHTFVCKIHTRSYASVRHTEIGSAIGNFVMQIQVVTFASTVSVGLGRRFRDIRLKAFVDIVDAYMDTQRAPSERVIRKMESSR